MTHVTIIDTPTFVIYDVVASDDGPFVVPFAVFEEADLTVLVDGVDIGAAFSFTPTSSTTGGYQTGTVTLDVAVANATVCIYRNISPVRTTDLGAGPLTRDAINSQWDRFQAQLQDDRRDLGRTLRLPVGESPDEIALGAAGEVLGLNASNNVVFLTPLDFAAVDSSWGGLLSGAMPAWVSDPLLVAIAAASGASGDILELTGPDTIRTRKLQVATYAAARLLSGLTVGDAVYVNGRTAAGDGGEGWRRVVAGATDNDGLTLTMADGKALILADQQEDLDTDIFGIVPGTVTVADFNNMVTTVNLQPTRTTLWRGGIYLFGSKPANITTIFRIEGRGESVTTLERNYSEGTSTTGFLEFRDASASNSMVRGALIRAAASTTGGTMIRLYATTTSIMGWPQLENVVVSPESGAYDWALSVDGRLNTTVGAQGIRSLRIHDSQFFGGGGAATNAVALYNVVNSHLSNVWTNGHLLISGGGSSVTNTTRLTVTGLECLGTVTIENCDHVFVSGTMDHVAINATAANVTIIGNVNNLTIAAGATGVFIGRISGTLTNNAPATFRVIGDPAKGVSPAFPVAGHIYGVQLANNAGDATNDIDIAAGQCADSTGAVHISVSALTKRLDAGWVAGTNQGMRNSAAAITDTTYHIYAVCKAGGADPDIYAHTSTTIATVLTALQAESGGSAYAHARRIGSIIRASAAIVGFYQDGDEFMLKLPANDIVTANPGTSAVTATLASVPTGVAVTAILHPQLIDATPGTSTNMRVSSLSSTDAAAASSNRQCATQILGAIVAVSVGYARVLANTSAQVRYRLDNSDADVTAVLTTHGWVDHRGRHG